MRGRYFQAAESMGWEHGAVCGARSWRLPEGPPGGPSKNGVFTFVGTQKHKGVCGGQRTSSPRPGAGSQAYRTPEQRGRRPPVVTRPVTSATLGVTPEVSVGGQATGNPEETVPGRVREGTWARKDVSFRQRGKTTTDTSGPPGRDRPWGAVHASACVRPRHRAAVTRARPSRAVSLLRPELDADPSPGGNRPRTRGSRETEGSPKSARGSDRGHRPRPF